MNKNAVIDFFGVVRIVGLSLLVCALLVLILGFTAGLFGMFRLNALSGVLLVWTAFPGAILLVVASVARPMVARMRFTPDHRDRVKQP